MPMTPTRMPDFTPQRRRGENTVAPAQSRGAATADSSDAGMANAKRPSTRMRRAKPPMAPTQVAF
jgi:hypothetical protein